MYGVHKPYRGIAVRWMQESRIESEYLLRPPRIDATLLVRMPGMWRVDSFGFLDMKKLDFLHLTSEHRMRRSGGSRSSTRSNSTEPTGSRKGARGKPAWLSTARRVEAAPSTPVPRAFDKLSWVAVSRFWSGWKQALIVVTPETVVRWHRADFRTKVQAR